MKKILFLLLIAFALSSSSSIESSKVESMILGKINSLIETIPNEDIKIVCKAIVNKFAMVPFNLIIEFIRMLGCEIAKRDCPKVFPEKDCKSVLDVICT